MALDEGGGEQVLLEGRDVTGEIRSETCGNEASKVAAIPLVRAALVALQHRFRRLPGLVADGRDMGTVIFPDATAKVFLTASPEARAQRRYKQLIEKGFDANLVRLCTEIAERDERDRKREVSPLIAADDALVLDTTAMNIDQVVQRVLEHLRACLAESKRKIKMAPLFWSDVCGGSARRQSHLSLTRQSWMAMAVLTGPWSKDRGFNQHV